jgi:hypothetical protein
VKSQKLFLLGDTVPFGVLVAIWYREGRRIRISASPHHLCLGIWLRYTQTREATRGLRQVKQGPSSVCLSDASFWTPCPIACQLLACHGGWTVCMARSLACFAPSRAKLNHFTRRQAGNNNHRGQRSRSCPFRDRVDLRRHQKSRTQPVTLPAGPDRNGAARTTRTQCTSQRLYCTTAVCV